eukprot:449372-Pyramimonas_sp.AAC.1
MLPTGALFETDYRPLGVMAFFFWGGNPDDPEAFRGIPNWLPPLKVMAIIVLVKIPYRIGLSVLLLLLAPVAAAAVAAAAAAATASTLMASTAANARLGGRGDPPRFQGTPLDSTSALAFG